MVVDLGAIIDHGHDVRIVAFVVIVKRIEEHTQAVPLV